MKLFREKIIPAALAMILYILTVGLGLLAIYLGRELFLKIYSLFSDEMNTAAVLSYVLVLVLAFIFLGVVILTGDFHWKNYGKPASWKLFLTTILVELAFPILALILGLSF